MKKIGIFLTLVGLTLLSSLALAQRVPRPDSYRRSLNPVILLGASLFDAKQPKAILITP